MKTAFINGCFEILTLGHLRLIYMASAFGEVIIGLNSDEYIVRKKGREPFVPLWERFSLLNGFKCIQRVVPFWEDTPVELIKIIKPDVIVKGGDYRDIDFPEKHLGIPIFYGDKTHSSSDVIKRIINSHGGK